MTTKPTSRGPASLLYSVSLALWLSATPNSAPAQTPTSFNCGGNPTCTLAQMYAGGGFNIGAYRISMYTGGPAIDDFGTDLTQVIVTPKVNPIGVLVEAGNGIWSTDGSVSRQFAQFTFALRSNNFSLIPMDKVSYNVKTSTSYPAGVEDFACEQSIGGTGGHVNGVVTVFRPPNFGGGVLEGANYHTPRSLRYFLIGEGYNIDPPYGDMEFPSYNLGLDIVHHFFVSDCGTDSGNSAELISFELRFVDSTAPVVPPPLGGVKTVPDLNNNSVPDFVVPVPGSTRMHVRDGSTGALIKDINFGDDDAFDFAIVPDLDGNGAPDIGVLQRRPTGLIRLLIKDSSSGATTGTNFFGDQFSAIKLAVTDDFSGNGLPEVAVLGVNDAGGIRVMIRDAATNTLVQNVYYGDKLEPSDIVFVPDFGGNGTPELATIGIHKTSKQIIAQQRDSLDKNVEQNVYWAETYAPVRTIAVPDLNSNGNPEIASLGYDLESLSIRLQVRDAADRTPISTAYLGNTHVPIDMQLVPDTNSNGFPDIAVLLRRADDKGQVRIYDSSSGAFIRNVFFTALSDPGGLAIAADQSGNAAAEIAVFGYNGGMRQVRLMDSVTGQLVNSIDFP